MNLSYKDVQFIIEALDYRIKAYQERLKVVEDSDEDEASDIANDCSFLEALRNDLIEALNNNDLVKAMEFSQQR